MTNETTSIQQKTPPVSKAKREIIRFNGTIPMALNLDHVTNMSLDGKKITFEFYQTAKYVEMENEAAAASVFEVMLRSWAGEQEKDALKAVIEWTVNKTLKWIALGVVVMTALGCVASFLLSL